jgi:hypothetical protein
MEPDRTSPKGKLERTAMKKDVKRAIPAALVLALVLMFPLPVSATITYSFNAFSPSPATATYDWTSSQQIISDTGSVNATGTGTYGFVFWDFSPAVGARFLSYVLNGTTYTIPFTIKKYISSVLGNELYAWTSGVTTNNVFSNTFTGAISNSTFQFAVVPTAGLIKPAGSYTTSITVGYYTGTKSGTSISNASLKKTAALGVTLTVPVIYDLSILPSANTTFDLNTYNQTLNFGDMTDGESMSVNAIMRTNATSWSLAVASTNGGLLKNNTTATTVPYTFKYNGTPKTLTATSTVIETGGWTNTSSGYATRPLTFTLGDTFNTPGTYTDNLTFTLTAS